MEESEEGSLMITITKYIHENADLNLGPKLCVHAIHLETGIRGIVLKTVMECPIDLLDNLETTAWAHPLLSEMRHEALQILVGKAEQAQSIQHEAFGILSERIVA